MTINRISQVGQKHRCAMLRKLSTVNIGPASMDMEFTEQNRIGGCS